MQASTSPESAGIIAPPPALYLGALALGFMLHILLPQPIFAADVVLRVVGVFLLALSGALARWAFVTMRHVGTSASPREPSVALVRSGPFRLSRNPIYVAMTGLYLGIAFLANSGWLLVLMVPLLVIMQWGVILREERYLAKRFGAAYSDYKAGVRRWL
jgi:protein-S-isoprenylcysteine O-methyltransferase Ste14